LPDDTKDRVTEAQTLYYGSNRTAKWFVIGYDGYGAVSENGTATLLSSVNLDGGQPFSAGGSSNSYVNSDIVNTVDGYYTSTSFFTTAEKSAIRSRNLMHGNCVEDDFSNLCDGISDEGPIQKNIWLLSAKEADLLGLEQYRTLPDTKSWWLRSPGGENGSAEVVETDGNLFPYGYCVSDYDVTVRPAFNIDLSSVVFTSAATGGKSSGAVGAGSLTAPSDYSGNEWKLTLLDGNRNFSAVRTDSGNVDVGSDVSVSYTGATVGTDEYISAILLNSSGDLLYYGRIADKSTGSSTGNARITIHSGLPDGEYTLKLFSEHYNTDKKTDLASAFNEIDILVGSASPSPEKAETVPEGKHIELTLPKLNPDGSDCMAKLYYPKNAVSYNSMQHVSAETSVPEKQKKKKCADIDTAVTGLPAMVTPEYVCKNNKKASNGKAYYYIKLTYDKKSVSFNALNKEEKKIFKKAVSNANKLLKKKENRIHFNIEKLNLSDFKYSKEKSSNSEVVFVRKDGGNDKLVLMKKIKTNAKTGFVSASYKSLSAEISGFVFKIPASEYVKTIGDDGITLKGKDKNVTGEVSTK
ncbi:MAG: DUF6273 domain-containing protein, partial [Lachnospiraceae bacterium]|nr:DUF6273 domain-containing protein [Lachnospiraceae bacterium]